MLDRGLYTKPMKVLGYDDDNEVARTAVDNKLEVSENNTTKA